MEVQPKDTKVLVVDDDIGLLTILKNTLARMGITPHTAANAAECLEHLENNTYHLLLLDLMLPDISGFDVLTQVRQEQRHNHMPVIVLTARTDSDAISKVLSLGADGYLTKPYLPNVLTERIAAILEKGRT